MDIDIDDGIEQLVAGEEEAISIMEVLEEEEEEEEEVEEEFQYLHLI